MTQKINKLNVVILYSSGHLGSAVVMNALLDTPEVNIVGVVKTQAIHISLKERKKLKQHYKNLGWQFAWLLLWQRIIQSLGFLISLLLPFLNLRLKPAWKIADEHSIPVFYCKNINELKCISFISALEPDLLVSAYFSQILKQDVINIPKHGVLNIHPGWLPAYKGAMAYFWVLKNNAHKGGVTIHWIDEGIDTGEILARRSFTIHQKSTQETVLLFTAVIGARLLRRVIKQLSMGNKPQAVLLNDGETDHYYPMPKEKDFDEYFQKRRFFKIRNLLSFHLKPKKAKY